MMLLKRNPAQVQRILLAACDASGTGFFKRLLAAFKRALGLLINLFFLFLTIFLTLANTFFNISYNDYSSEHG
jgi:hypothetical protein